MTIYLWLATPCNILENQMTDNLTLATNTSKAAKKMIRTDQKKAH